MSMFPLITKYPSNGLHKLHIAKVGSNVKARFVGDTPRAKFLIRIRLRADNGSEEVHPPLCTLCLAFVDIEQAQGNRDIAHPQLIRLVELGHSAKPVGRRVGHEEVVKGGAIGANFGRVVHKGLVGDVVGVHFELKVSLRVVRALVYKGLHDLVLPDVGIGALGRVKVEVDLVAGGELDVQVSVGIAEVNLGAREWFEVGDSLVVFDCAEAARACWDSDRGDFGVAVG